ncbi:acyloxyacyl hydrolase [Pelagibacteraceae bacterium]|nr:acyloxyacyl hydrolase [Pelagibacteraceae bacterium]
MKFIITIFIATFLMANNYAFSGPLDKLERGLDKLFGQEPESGADVKAAKKKKIKKISKNQKQQPCKNKKGILDSVEGSLDKIFGQEVSTPADAKCQTRVRQVKKNTNTDKIFSYRDSSPHNISVYAGTWDLIDKEGDEKTSLLGVEHKNKNLFRNTWIGRFSPTTGALVTGRSSIYLYTGIEADYNLGPISISPSFAPGYYEAGNGKNLGSALEFKSEIKVGLNLFKDSKLGYSYSHISNNDWGDINPGVDNQAVTFSKKF